MSGVMRTDDYSYSSCGVVGNRSCIRLEKRLGV